MILYTYDDLRAKKDQLLAIWNGVRRANPTAWRHAHNGAFDRESRRFNDLCVQATRAAGIDCGLNGKRGDPNSKSDDVVNFGLVAGQGGARDKSGRAPEIAIIDFIIGAGTSGAYIGWIDQSDAAPGYFLDPEGLPADVWGPEGGKPPVVTPPPPPVAPPLPPDADLADATRQVEAYYRDNLGRPSRPTAVDELGYGRWIGFDYVYTRGQGASHQEALDAMFQNIVAITGVPQ